MTTELSLTLYEVMDTDDSVVHLDVADMNLMGISVGDVIALEGARRTCLIVAPAALAERNQRLARVSPLTVKNLGLSSGQKVRLLPERLRLPIAELITLEATDDLDGLHARARQKQISGFWNRRPLTQGDELIVPTLDRYPLRVKVAQIQPAGPVQIASGSQINVQFKSDRSLPALGGMREPYRFCQDLACARFAKGGGGEVAPAKSVYLHGPVGCGKAHMLARLAQDMRASFDALDTRKLIDNWLLHGPADLSGFLAQIGRRGPAILVFDHMELLDDTGDVASPLGAARHGVTAQFMALLEELPTQPTVMIFGVSSRPLDDAFAGGGLFDLRLQIDPPDRWGRAEIFLLATEGLALTEDIDVGDLAASSVGMTARDINAVVRAASLLARGGKISSSDFMEAMRTITPSANSDVTCDTPAANWGEVAGLDDIKNLLHETVGWSLRHAAVLSANGIRPPRSILLSGGQGTGKTSLVRALAAHMPVRFIEVACPVLVARSMEETQRFLMDTFALARRKAPCILFLDDIDAFFERSDEAQQKEGEILHHRVVAQLMAELDSLTLLSGVVVIAATNRPDRLSNETLRSGRFDYAITLPMPDQASRKKVLQIHARKLLLSDDVDFDHLASATHGMSSSDIANLCNRVGLMALRRAFVGLVDDARMPIVCAEHFEQALRGRK